MKLTSPVVAVLDAVADGAQPLVSALPAQSAVLPEGFALPPLPYLIVLVLGLATVAALLYALKPPVTNATVVALTPWMATGGLLHALDQVREFPNLVEPLFGTAAIYATTAIFAGTLWIIGTFYAAMGPHSPHRPLGVIGTGVFVTFATFSVYEAIESPTMSVDPIPASIAIVVTGVVAAIVWAILGIRYTDAAAFASWTGAVVVVSHTLDGVSTAVGYDYVGASERSPLSAAILDAGAMLPTAEYIGAGWLFVLVKLLLASAIVVLFREWLREEPRQARLVLAGVAAVGIGPAVNNLVIFTLAA